MNKEEIKEDLLGINNKTGSKSRMSYVKKHYFEAYIEIIKLDGVENWYEKLYWYLNGIDKQPICKKDSCNNVVNFAGYSKGYYDYCCINCRNTDINLIKQTKISLIEKYGVDNPMKLETFKERGKKTKLLKYGDENYNNQNKMKQTKLLKYGDENYSNREQAVITTKDNFGSKNYGNRIKAILTTEKKYGVKYFSQTKEFKRRISETYDNKTEIENFNTNEKRKKTMLDKYGVEFFAQSNESHENFIDKQIIKRSKQLNLHSDDISYDIINKMFVIRNHCKVHDDFKISYDVLKNRIVYKIKNVCTICNPVSTSNSIAEKEIFDYINEELLILPMKTKIDGKEIDIYLPENSLGIEYNGLYWHSNINREKDYHINKTNLAENNGIQLIHVFENEWKNKEDIVKSIIKSKLGIFDEKIYARKCEVREIIDTDLVRDFLNTNHIQGFIGSKIKIGLFYNNELVAIMTFGGKRSALGSKISSENEYELLRFSNKLNIQIIGGASKLLAHFIRNYKPKEIITYADRRYSRGKLYLQLGFEFIKNTEPNYWYFKPHEYILYHRFRFRKDVLVKQGFDAQKTEHQIMSENGYYHIYDSGNMKFKLILE